MNGFSHLRPFFSLLECIMADVLAAPKEVLEQLRKKKS